MVYKDKKCEYCNKVFTPLSGKTKFCSKDHAYKSKRAKLLKWREDNPEVYKKACNKYNENRDIKNLKSGKRVLKFEKVICEVCKKDFTPTSPGKIYCSKKCRGYNENEIKKAKRAKNPEIFRKNDKKHYYSNLSHTRDLRNTNSAIRRKNNPHEKISNSLRTRLRRVLKNKNHKQTSVLNLIGCTVKELKTYLESLFVDGMSWKNYGQYGWHIDHIKPCIAFDLTTIKEQEKCFHYTNLQPLWAVDNLSKGGKYNEN